MFLVVVGKIVGVLLLRLWFGWLLVGESDLGGRVSRDYIRHTGQPWFSVLLFSGFGQGDFAARFERTRSRQVTCVWVISTDINSQVPWHSKYHLHACCCDGIYTLWIANTHPALLPPPQWTPLAMTRGNTRTALPSRPSNTLPTALRRITSNTRPLAPSSPSLRSTAHTINTTNIHIRHTRLKIDRRPCTRKTNR